MLIAIEGLDGSGKSTITTMLENEYQMQKLEKRPDFLRKGIRTMRSASASPHDLHVAFLMTLGYASDLYVKGEWSRPQIVETWLGGEIHSYQLYAKALGLKYMDINYHLLPIAKPDYVFYLKPDYGVRVARLFERNKKGALDDFDERTKTPEAEASFVDIMNKMYDSYHIIDTAQPVEKSCADIISVLNLHHR